MSWRNWLLRSIHGRLLLTLCVGLSLLMALMFVSLDFSIDRKIYQRLDDDLLQRARGISALLETPPIDVAMARLQTLHPAYAGGGHTEFLQVWDAQGRTLVVSGSNAAGRLELPSGVKANQPRFYDLALPDDHRGRAVALRLLFPGASEPATLVVAEEREHVDRFERSVHVALLVGVLATALSAALLAIITVRRGLRPLLAFGQAARAPDETPRLSKKQLPRELTPFAEALNGAFDRLHAGMERERRFSRDVAHELRTPLAEMRAALEVAQRDPGRTSSLDNARAAIDRMQRCIDSLLAVSSYESGLAQPELEPMDLVPLLRRAMGTDARVDAALPAEAWVQSDPALLERIVDNLMLNAREYAPTDARIEVTLAKSQGQWRLRIGNAAPELTGEDLPHLGQRFWRKSPAREATRHGGLGLALAGTLAGVLSTELRFELRGGVLWVTLGPLPDIDSIVA
ncbi:histidine kinase dimerization/phospho-acceptor domain-containing protein [Dyella sp. EPa41]|uniref:histidine kinase dimerization/phospho-acceptor domain-containing protein n=1 Tax=Dyella sp. EPa41 TaxID=1561194 RepID=UPI0019152C95|nr:histidine kinase dimerization/phospho-acceptor domain-containing protein [Dyella sp. EPa41]